MRVCPRWILAVGKGSIPQASFERWTADFGGPLFGGQQSASEFMQRVASAWDKARPLHVDTVWVTHAGVIRAATLLARGARQVAQADQWSCEAPGFGRWCEMAL